jgi:hypothetical protein
MKFHIYDRQQVEGLWDDELSLIFDAQREILSVGGSLGLYGDLTFVFAATEQYKGPQIGVLCVREEDDQTLWIQMAFVKSKFRRQGVLSQMVEWLAVNNQAKRIGLATRCSNGPMRAASAAMGFTQEVLYFYRKPVNRLVAQ